MTQRNLYVYFHSQRCRCVHSTSEEELNLIHQFTKQDSVAKEFVTQLQSFASVVELSSVEYSDYIVT